MIGRGAIAWLGIAVSACGRPSVEPDAGRALVAETSDARCISCHEEAAASWRSSAHRTAFVDEVFQAEWGPTRQAACVRCHAPLADPEAPGEAAELGVSCVTCHVRDGEVLATHASPAAPHPIRVDDSLSTEAACAGCHDFSFAAVAPTRHHVSAPLQRTVHEWSEVSDRGTCQRCHMREGHAMPGARDPELLTRSLAVEATAHDTPRGTMVTLALTSRAGHAVPTGDMYRRLEVRAWRDGEAPTRTTLMRRFEHRDGRLREVSDDRVPARGAREVTLELPPGTTPIHWAIEWQALDPRLAAERFIPDEDARRLVTEGTID